MPAVEPDRLGDELPDRPRARRQRRRQLVRPLALLRLRLRPRLRHARTVAARSLVPRRATLGAAWAADRDRHAAGRTTASARRRTASASAPSRPARPARPVRASPASVCRPAGRRGSIVSSPAQSERTGENTSTRTAPSGPETTECGTCAGDAPRLPRPELPRLSVDREGQRALEHHAHLLVLVAVLWNAHGRIELDEGRTSRARRGRYARGRRPRSAAAGPTRGR